MVFTSIFGKQYKRNPNLIDTNYSFEECNFLHNAICSINCNGTENKLLITPVLDKLSIYDNCFLQSELHFVQTVLEELIQETGSTVYSELLDKTNSYLTEESIKENQKKAKLN